MRLIFASLALASVSLASPAAFAAAQAAAPSIMPGTQVVDTKGGAVGVVASVNGDTLVIRTDKLEAAVSASSVTPSNGKLLIGMTQAELNAATEQSLAALAAKIAPGAEVHGTGGAVLGTIESLDTDFATLKLTSGTSIRLPRTSLGADANGVIIGLTAEQLEAQLGASSQ